MAKNKSEKFNFQHYVNGVKQKEISWKFFVDLMQDLSHSNIDRLRNLNAILLMELTMNYSDMDKLKYLNEILINGSKKADLIAKNNLKEIYDIIGLTKFS